MMNSTMFDPIALQAWSDDPNTSHMFKEELTQYLDLYYQCFQTNPQRELFSTFIQGLLSPLERKSIEPIALHLKDESYVRSLQQFFSRSTFQDQLVLDVYQQQFCSLFNAPGGMLSVDDTAFIKKGTHSIGVKRQYCGRLGKTENCQSGVFLAYASEKGYGLVDYELYIPSEWFSDSFASLREECHLPESKEFQTKNEIAQQLLNQVLANLPLEIQWIGCDAAYGNDHAFLDGLELPPDTWYFAATNAKEQVFLEYPEIIEEPSKRGRPRKHPRYSCSAVSVQELAQDPGHSWEKVLLAEGSKGPIYAERKCFRCYCSRKDGNRNYIQAGEEVWLYMRKYANGDIKYFISNAPAEMAIEELDRAATLRWPIEQCFEECKSNLGMGHYESRSYRAWMRHMMFVMVAHLFTNIIRGKFKKKSL